MITKILPSTDQVFAPNIKLLKAKELNWYGRYVYWVRDASNYNIIYKVAIQSIFIFTSILMIISIVLLPLFLIIYREMIRQDQRNLYETQFKKFLNEATTKSAEAFVEGRQAPLEYLQNLTPDLESTALQDSEFIIHDNLRFFSHTLTNPLEKPETSSYPVLTPIESPPLSCIGRLVDKIRHPENFPLINKVALQAIAIFASIIMIASIILFPLFIVLYGELIRQQQQSIYNTHYAQIFREATDNIRTQFLEGRIEPLHAEQHFEICEDTRKLLLNDLGIANQSQHTDIHLIRLAAEKYTNYLARYQFNLVC